MAKDEIIKREYVVLVEGQMDVITAHQAGTSHVVATSGTAMTEEQLRQLTRFTKTIALALDTDSAGQAAMLRIVELVGDRDIELKVVDLGEAKDPDDLIQNKPNLWEKKLAMAEPVIDHVFRKELEPKQKPYSRETIADVLDSVLPVLKYRPSLDQDFYAEQFAATLGLEKASVLDRLKKQSGNKAAPKTPEAHQQLHKTPEDLVSERLIGIVLTTPDLKPKLAEVDIRIFPEPYQKAAEAAKSTYTDNSDRALESLLTTCSMAAAEYEPMAATDRATEFDRLYARLKLLWIKQHQPKLLAAIKRAEVTGDKDRRNQLMEEYVTLTRRIANG
jgi:DNA primase